MKPILVITMGATGSGKSKLAKEMISLLKIKNPVYFLIDDYVEKDEGYKRKIKRFSKKKNLYSKLRNPSKKTLKYFEKAYFHTRKHGCKKRLKKKTIPKNKCIEFGKGGCDRLMDIDLNNAILKQRNIIFETTGEYYSKWLIEAINKCKKYKIVIGGIKVSLNNLVKRNLGRSQDDMRSFIEDDLSGAPRLPDTNKSSLQRQKSKLNKTLKNIILNGCIKGSKKKNIDFCSKYSIDRLLIFDNNKSLRIIYDSKK